MTRAGALALLSGAIVSCGDSGPESAFIGGIWQLRTVNGQDLPAPSAAFRSPMAGGILRLVAGSSWTEFCVDRGAGEMVPFHRTGAFEEIGSGRALVLYYASSGPGSIPADTFIVSGDAGTLNFRQGAAATDVLRFGRIAGVEMPASATPSACP